MAKVTETKLPGVGVRYEFTTTEGERAGVLFHRSGRRELVVYDREDPDACRTVLHLSADDTRTLAELLGASQVAEAVAAVQQQVEGLAIDWVTVPDGSPFAGSTVGQGRFRTRTGASIVAVLRGGDTMPAPGPEQVLEAGDVAVVVGTTEGLAQFRHLLRE
jgi:TrkA domain protein